MNKILKGEICPYCNCKTELVSDKAIYGEGSNYGGMYYQCELVKDHYVGTYSDNITSLGRIADRELRKLKMQGHKAFDPLWKSAPKYFSSRPKAYHWLSKKMGIEISETHFGMFDNQQCKDAVQYCQSLKHSKLKYFYILRAKLNL
jgi:hypothetical protein